VRGHGLENDPRHARQEGSPQLPFDRRLTALRKQRGLTQVDLARALGAIQRAVSYNETQAERPPGPWGRREGNGTLKAWRGGGARAGNVTRVTLSGAGLEAARGLPRHGTPGGRRDPRPQAGAGA